MVSSLFLWATFFLFCCVNSSSSGSSTSGSGSDSSNLYDFIIVGAGSAGSMVASELSTYYDNDISILLIEEGPYSNVFPIIDDASKWGYIFNDSLLDRDYSTPIGPSSYDRIMHLVRGRVTGGSNAVNANIYMLANENDFEKWGNIEDWTLDDVLEIWNEITDVNPGHQYNSDNKLIERFIQSAEENGYKFNSNWNNIGNGNTQVGVCPAIIQSFYRNDSYIKRRTSWTDFILPIFDEISENENDKNLDISVFTRVNKVLFEKDNSNSNNNNNDTYTAIGVETYNIGTGEITNYYASKEVILSAGTYDTPKILMLSGLGDCNELNNLNIECLKDIPGIGQNLQDHLIFVGSAYAITKRNNLEQFLDEIPAVVKNHQTNNWFTIAISDDSKYHHMFTVQTGGLSTSLILSLGGEFGEIFDRQVWSIVSVPILTQLTSKGNVTLYDNDASSKPKIDHNYLSTEEDRYMAINAINIARSLLQTEALSDYTSNNIFEILPGRRVNTDNEKLDYIYNTINSIYHPVGTCKMGQSFDDDNDNTIVVNNKLKLKNINNLRIADASIMPIIVSANTNQMAMVIGKKAAKFIIQDYPNQNNQNNQNNNNKQKQEI